MADGTFVITSVTLHSRSWIDTKETIILIYKIYMFFQSQSPIFGSATDIYETLKNGLLSEV